MKIDKLQDKLDQLYKEIDPTAKKQDDKYILRNELASINAKTGYAAPGTEWHEKIKKRNANKSSKWIGNISKAISAKQSDPGYKAHMSKQRNEDMDQLLAGESITLREKLTKANQKSAKNPEHHKNRTEANRRLKFDPKWKEAHAKGVLSYSEECKTPNGIYPSMGQWIKKNQKPGGRSFLNTLPHLFYLTKDGPGTETYERIYQTPFGKCATDRHAYDLCKENNETNALKLKNISGWWLKMATLYPKKYFISFEVSKYWAKEKKAPFGMAELESKPRIKKVKLDSVVKTWEARLALHKTLYKSK